jgi:alkylation response protein AidB-like acyl-CoA dehydrogenase
MIEMGIVCEEAGRALYPGPLASSALGGAYLLVRAGSAAEQAELLPRIAAGESIAALAADGIARGTEAPPPVEARSQSGGSRARLTGEIAPVLDGLVADVLLVVANDAARHEQGIFFVDPASPGVLREPLETVDLTRPRIRLRLDSAEGRRLSGESTWQALAAALDCLTVGAVADGLGAAGRAFELALAYAHERIQFDRPIGSFQAVQHLLVDMLQDLELARAALYYALWAAECAEPRERHRAAAMAKAFASRALPRVGESVIQIFGGIGFTWEHDAHLFYKRILTMQHSFGDARVHLDEIARIAIDNL